MANKVFISQPMKGKDANTILREREIARAKILLEIPEAVFLESYFESDFKEKHPGLKYLARSLELLDEADIAYFLDDFISYRGCRVEFDCCNNYHIPRKHIRTFAVSENINTACLVYQRNTGRIPRVIQINEHAFELLKIECRPYLGLLLYPESSPEFDGVPLEVVHSNDDTVRVEG